MTQLTLLEETPMPKPAHPYPLALGPRWTRLSDAKDGKTRQHFTHDAGYDLQHCGHPTAIWPWQLIGPDGQLRLAPNGRAFRDLADVRTFVEGELAGCGVKVCGHCGSLRLADRSCGCFDNGGQ